MASSTLRFALAPLLWVTLLGTVTAACAEDSPGSAEESSLTWKGITLYGVVDIGLQYQTHGAPASDFVSTRSSPSFRITLANLSRR